MRYGSGIEPPGDWFPAFQTETRGVIQQRWPEITGTQFFTAYQAQKIDLVQGALKGVLTFPMAVVEIGVFDPISSRGIQNHLKAALIRIWYLNELTDLVTISEQQAVQAKLYALGDFIDINDFESFQTNEDCEMYSGHNSAANERFIAGGIQLFGGCVAWPSGWITGELTTFE